MYIRLIYVFMWNTNIKISTLKNKILILGKLFETIWRSPDTVTLQNCGTSSILPSVDSCCFYMLCNIEWTIEPWWWIHMHIIGTKLWKQKWAQLAPAILYQGRAVFEVKPTLQPLKLCWPKSCENVQFQEWYKLHDTVIQYKEAT